MKRNRLLRPFWFNEPPADPPAEGGQGGGGGGGATPPPADPPPADPPASPMNPAPSSEGGGSPPADPPAPSSGKDPAAPPPSDPPADPPAPDAAERWSKSLPEDWREQMAGDDEAKLNVLKRFNTPEDVISSFFDGREKISKGLIETGLPEDPTDEQLAQYREAHNIPEKPDGYELKLDEGLVLGEKDREQFSPVYEAMHNNHISSEAASQITNAFLKQQEAQAEQIEQQDLVDSQNVMGMLKEQWGGETQANINLVKGLFAAQLPQESQNLLYGARLPNGKALFNDPSFLTAFAGMARKLNPAATLVPNTADPMKSLQQEKADLEKKMKDDIDAWHKDTESKKRYGEVLQALEQQQAIDGG